MWLQQQQQPPEPSPPLPADHVLFSGAVSFPGAFDQLGSPLVVFPVAGQAQISSALSKAEVVDFINYCLFQHNKMQRSSLVSVVADLREASASSTRFIAETLLLLEQKRTVHSAYIIQPKRKDALRLLVKLWTSSKTQPVTFKKVLLKEVFELSNYIDRSQLPASLGGYFVYCHQSWAVFTKEMAAFAEHFVSVAQRLPGSLSALQALSTLPLPSSAPELQLYCSANEAHFQLLQRELGLDDLLRHSELLLERLRSPDLDPHFQAMAGTALFTQYFSIIVQQHRRITATVKKVELLRQEVFSKARLQLHVLQLRDAALQITEQIESLLQQKLQPYDIEIAGDGAEAERLASEFHSSVYTPAMSLVAAAEEVVRTLTEVLSDAPSRERWLLDLHRLKEKLHSTVHVTLQTLRAVSKYHRYYNKARSWYLLVLSENYLQKLLSEVDRQRQMRSFGTLPTWKRKLSGFLKNNPPPKSEELVHLAHLSNVIPDKRLQQEGMQLSQRCMTLKRLVLSSEPLTVAEIQVALQWQYELLRSSLGNQSFSPDQRPKSASTTCPSSPLHRRAADRLRPSTTAEGKPSSLSSFDSGFDGAGSQLDGLTVTPDCGKRVLNQPQIQEETVSGLSDSDGFGSLGNSSRASVHLGPRSPVSALNFEIKVKRSTAHPSNRWLSLPDEDLENSYTVTVMSKPTLEHSDVTDTQFHKNLSPLTPAAPPTAWHSHSSLEESELGPITHVLSSTVTEPKDQTCTPGGPSMIWDSYDLHDQYLNETEGVSTHSLKDWDIKEQENLTEVERILERADKILTEEESVLEQEAQLDVLLQSEEGPLPWLAWDNQMSFTELTSDSVLIPDQVGAKSQLDWDCRYNPDLLTELKAVHALDQRILEENFKIHQLRGEERPEEDVQRTTDTRNRQSTKIQLGEENSEQETGEKDNSVEKCQTQNHKERATKVIRCSVMSRTISKEDRDIYDGLLSGQRSSERAHSERENKDMLRTSDCNDADLKAVGSSEECSNSKAMLSSISSALGDSEERPANTADGPPSVLPASHSTLVTDTDPVHPTSVPQSVSPNRTVSEECRAAHPIPKPRKTTSLALNKLREQHSSHTSENQNVSPEDTMDICVSSEGKAVLAKDTGGKCESSESRASSVSTGDTEDGCLYDKNTDIGDRYVPALDTGDEDVPTLDIRDGDVPVLDTGDEDVHAVDTGDRDVHALDIRDGDVHALDFRDGDVPAVDIRGGDVPAVDSGDRDVPAVDTGDGDMHALDFRDGDVPMVDIRDGNVPALDTEDRDVPALDSRDGDVPALDFRDGDVPAEPPSQGVNIELHTNNNNNNRVSSVPGSGRTHSTDDVTEEAQIEDMATSPHSRDTPYVEMAPPIANSVHNFEKEEGTKMSAPEIQDQFNISTTLPADFETPIVLDTGSGLMKAGFADQDLPSVVFPTILGAPKYEEMMNGRSEKDVYVGHEAQQMRGVLTLRHPIKHGLIRNWDDMEMIWQHTFDLLRVDPVDHPVLLTDAPMNPLENKQRAVEIMFEFFGVPYSYIAMQAVLALYAAGRTTGVVLDSGNGVTHSVPVYDGYTLPYAVQRFPLAGADITANLTKLLQEQGVCMRTSAEQEIVREMKEKCCCVALDYEAELREGASCREMSYTLPDGRIVTLGLERIRAPEILFKPELIGRDHYGLHESVYKSILISDLDLRRCFLGNILLSGGNTLLPGLPERLEAELSGLVPHEPRSSVRVCSPSDRDYSVWCGGAVLANMPSFSGAWISQSEYEEYGPLIVHRKCF